MNLKDLAKEFPKEAISWRAQGKPYEGQSGWSAMALAYIDARDVMDRLDEVCGPENWQVQYTETPSGRVLGQIGILIGDKWVWKADGAGATQVEGEKGGISDALKRAAVPWGIGRYLYRFDSPWVPCTVKQKGGNTYFKDWAESPWNRVKVKPGYAAPANDDLDGVSAWETAVWDKAGLTADHEPTAIATAYAEQVRADVDRYKTVRGINEFLVRHKSHLTFIEMHLPEGHEKLREHIIEKREGLAA